MKAVILLLLLAAASVEVLASGGVDSTFTYLFDAKKSSDSTLEKVLGSFSYCQNLVGDANTDIKVTLELDRSSFSNPINPTENFIGVAFRVNLGTSPLSDLVFSNWKTEVFCTDCTLSTFNNRVPVVCLKAPTTVCQTEAKPWFPITPATDGYYDVEIKLTMPSDGKVQRVSFMMSYPGKNLDASTLSGTDWYFRFQETEGGQSSKMGGTLPLSLPGCIKVKSIADNCYGQSYGWTVDKTLTTPSPMSSGSAAGFTITATKSSTTTTHLTVGGLVAVQNNAGSTQTIQRVNVKLVKICDDGSSTGYDIATVAGDPLPKDLANGGVVALHYDAAVNLDTVDLQCTSATGRKLLVKRPRKRNPRKRRNSPALPGNTRIQLNSIITYPNYQVVVDVIVVDPASSASQTVQDISVAFTLPETPNTWFSTTSMTDTLTLPAGLTCSSLKINSVDQTTCPSPTLFTRADIAATTTIDASLALANAATTELVANNSVQLVFADVAPVGISLTSLDESSLTHSIPCVTTPAPSGSAVVTVLPVPGGGDPPAPPHTNCTTCCTYTKGGYGGTGGPGKKLVSWYGTKLSPEPVIVGGEGPSITLTSASAIQTMLRIRSGTPGQLSGDLYDPTTDLKGAGNYGQQVVTLWLNLEIGGDDIPPTSIGALLYCPPAGSLFLDLKGKTVTEILALAEGVLSRGGPGAGRTISDWNELVDDFNNSYDNCKYNAVRGQYLYVGKACP